MSENDDKKTLEKKFDESLTKKNLDAIIEKILRYVYENFTGDSYDPVEIDGVKQLHVAMMIASGYLWGKLEGNGIPPQVNCITEKGFERLIQCNKKPKDYGF